MKSFLGFICILVMFAMISAKKSTCSLASLPRVANFGLLETDAKLTYGSKTVRAECPLPGLSCVASMSVYLADGTQYTPETIPYDFKCSNGKVLFHDLPLTGIFCAVACW
ncbi:unnamed protein product [Caenorhabditis auriculariae]|uniref:Uncharacterized protein n=1 Tax=Caenorhabditis auriculariae TaxID=2777116 RepID=A0A8S1HRY6_9PELO|nr:unnamed protein product [Caenorhabditis auriculariae]